MQCSPDIIQANAGVLFHAVELQAFNAMLEQCWICEMDRQASPLTSAEHMNNHCSTGIVQHNTYTGLNA
jgi:hypothetical protein